MLYVLIFSLLLNAISIFYCIKFALTLLRVQESIEDSLDKIDEKYSRLSQIVKIPVFYDSPEIKRVIGEVLEVQDVILEIANNLSNSTMKETSAQEDNEELT